MADEAPGSNIIELAAELTAAWLSNPNTKITADELPAAIQKIYGALDRLSAPSEEPEAAPEYTPAVNVRRSLASPDHLISMIDGKPYKMLKRHLSLHGLTPDAYRQRYGLKADYPMVAENYAARRREIAKTSGLGRKPGTKVAAAAKKTGKSAPRKTAAKGGADAGTPAPAPAAVEDASGE
jgi:predicted transcriptional regulator